MEPLSLNKLLQTDLSNQALEDYTNALVDRLLGASESRSIATKSAHIATANLISRLECEMIETSQVAQSTDEEKGKQ